MTTSNTHTADDQLDRPAWLDTERWPFVLRVHRHRDAADEPLDIHYTDEGTGPTLVFVHVGMWSFIWRDAIAALSPRFRCVTLDFPGTGLSGGGPADIDLGRYPAILDAVLGRCGVGRATFVVHDLGGVVGILTAAGRPGMVDGLVAANSFAWPPDRVALRAMLRVMGGSTMTGVAGSLRIIPRLTSTSAGVGRHLDPLDRRAFLGPYRSRAAGRNFHLAMRSAAGSVEAFAEAERALRGPLATAPLLTVFGEKNDQFGFVERWSSLNPSAQSHTVPGGNHFPMCDDPVGFADEVARWHDEEVAATATQGMVDGHRVDG